MKYETFNEDCYNLYTINTNKFKSSHMEVVFRNNCTKEGVTYLALLFDCLIENNKEYTSHKLLSRRLEELYNTNIYSVNSRVGNTMLSNIVIDFLDNKYTEENTLEDIIKLVFTIIFNPNIDIDGFEETTFNRVKSRLKKEIESVKDDPKQSSILDALKKLDETSPRSFNSSGDTSILEEITPKKLYKFYKKIIDESLIDIYLIGNINMKEASKLIKKNSKFTSIKTETTSLYLDDIKQNKVINAAVTNENTQTNVVELYKFTGLNAFEMNYVMPVFNLLWGSGSLESKLYKSVRGENALCYNINTYYQKYDKVLIVHTGIDSKNYELTLKLIKRALNEMIKGEISEEELNNVKNMLVNSLNLIYDSPSKLIDNYLFTNIASLPEIETRIDNFKKVQIQDLINISKKIKLVLNYRVGA